MNIKKTMGSESENEHDLMEDMLMEILDAYDHHPTMLGELMEKIREFLKR